MMLSGALVAAFAMGAVAFPWARSAAARDHHERSAPAETAARATTPAVTPVRSTDAHSVEDAIVAATDASLQSVVSIEVEIPVATTRGVSMQPLGSGGAVDPFGLLRWFGQPLESPDQQGEIPEQIRTGGGSGVIHTSDGVIVTNNHVVENARSIRVTLHDGRTFDAELVGADPQTDLAVIRIDAHDLPAVDYADSDQIKPGQFAIAVGMPYHLDYSVTVGHVSALGRGGLQPSSGNPFEPQKTEPSLSIQNFIQTDASINPGNSGGPLVDLDGRVMGINSIVHSGIGGGFGFAIPAAIVQRVARDLLEDGTVSRAWVGLSMTPLTYEKAQALGVDQSHGALVEEVVDGGPADDAKMRRGDVIVAVDGNHVKDADDVVYRVTNHRAGEPVEVTYVRDGKTKTVRIVGGDRDDGLAENTPAASGAEDEDASDSYGMMLEGVDARVNRALGRPDDAEGALVRSVAPAGPASRAGLQPGDVIVEVDGETIHRPDQIADAIEGCDRDFVPLSVEREGHHRFVALKKLTG